MLTENEIIAGGNGSAIVCSFQAEQVKEGQRLIFNSGNASMGYGLPCAIGACIASGKKRTICFEGDGSIMMNLQELQTVFHHKLPIKIFIINNNGYSSIKQTQTNFFNGHLTACTKESGVSFPDFVKIGTAFGIKSVKIEKPEQMEGQIRKYIDSPEPVIYDVITDSEQIFTPKLSSEKLPDGKMISKPLEDMYPFLDREEFYSNMISGEQL